TGGTSNVIAFTVNPPVPTLTSIAPPSGAVGNAVPVTLTGTNFVTGATVAITGSGVTVGAVTIVNSTSITTTFTIAADAPSGARDVTVTTSGGPSNVRTFTVNPP